ncbi:MAG: hypothetical protein Q4C12_03970 [Clostridia bacterium]|nr:hypothetical protein [Clostridia bacterium]
MMKKRMPIISAALLALLLTACGGMSGAQKDAYNQAYLASDAMSNFTIETSLNVVLHEAQDTSVIIKQQCSVNNAFADNMQYKISTDSRIIAPAEEDVASASSNVVTAVLNTYYYQDEMYYLDLAEGKYAMAATRESAINDVHTARRLFDVDPEDFKSVKCTEHENGALTVEFTADYSEVEEYMGTVFETMGESLDIEKDIQNGDIAGTVIIDAQGFIRRQTIVLQSSGVSDKGAFSVDTEMDIVLTNHGENVSFVMPEISEFSRIS